MRAIFTEILAYGSNETHNHAQLVNIKLESTEILEIRFFFIPSDSCHTVMLLESLNIPLTSFHGVFS